MRELAELGRLEKPEEDIAALVELDDPTVLQTFTGAPLTVDDLVPVGDEGADGFDQRQDPWLRRVSEMARSSIACTTFETGWAA